MEKIKIGWGEASIVPEGRRVNLRGQFYERISGEVETPISVTALALECGEEQAVFVSCDLVDVASSLLREVREKVSSIKGLNPDAILMSAIHTHTSMSYASEDDSYDASLLTLNKYKPAHINYVPMVHDESADILRGREATDFLVERISRAITEAWESRAEGAFAFGFGRAAVGMCRRVCYDDGSAKMWGNASHANFTELEGGNDSGIELMFTYDEKKKLTGVVANVACPAQVLEHQSFISSDYMGKVKGLLREKFGEDLQFLGLVSPAGDMCPRDMIRWVDSPVCKNDPNIHRDLVIPRRADPSMFEIKGCEKVAKRIVNEIVWALEDVTETVCETTLLHKKLTLEMPLRRVTVSDYLEAERAVKDFFASCEGDINHEDNAKMMIYAGTLERFEVQKKVDLYPIEMHVLRLGDVAFATNPYELFLNYGNQMRARSLAKQTFLIQLSCGSFGYLPTKKAQSGSHYSAFVSSGSSGYEGGELLVRKTISEINKLFEA